MAKSLAGGGRFVPPQGGGRLVPPTRWWQVGATKVVASWCSHPPAPSIAGDWRAAAAACMPCPVCPPPPLGLLDMSAQLTPAGRHPPTLPWLSHLVLLLLLVHNLTLHQLTKSPPTTCLKVSPTPTQGAQRRKASQPLQWPSPLPVAPPVPPAK